MIKIFENFFNDIIDLDFGDIVTYRGIRKHHKRDEKAMVMGIKYDEKNGHAYYRIEFSDGGQKICREQLIQKRIKKTYDDIRFESKMKKKPSYLYYKNINDETGGFLFVKEKQKKEIARKEKKRKEREKKREEIRLKMLDIDPYGEEDWGMDDYDPELDGPRWMMNWRLNYHLD